MNSKTSERFRKLFYALPLQVQEQARNVYRLFSEDPFHPSLHFKRVHSSKPIYSVRINIEYRALGTYSGSEVVWFWIGTHGDYDKLLNRL